MEKYSVKRSPAYRTPTVLLEKDSRPELAYLQCINSADFGCPRTLHSHTDVVEFVLIKQGSSTFLIDGQTIPVKEGDLAIYNSNIVHSENFSNDSNIVLYCCAIRGLHLLGMRENAFAPDHETPVFTTGEHFLQLKRLIEIMFLIQAKPLKHTRDISSHLIHALLFTIQDVMKLTENSQREQVSELCQRITAYLAEHYKEDLSVQQIADAINISPYHMCHVFKESSGYSPLQYVILRRLGEAQTLLEHTSMPASKIGSIVGFPNPAYFNYIFRKKVGMSPLQYRKIYTYSKDDTLE